MDVRMPDGTIITNVPEGTTKDQLLARLNKVGAPVQVEDYDPTEGNSFAKNALIGVGKGMTDLYMGGKQALGLASDEDVAEKRRIDEPLMSTVGGNVGNVIGQAAALAPAALIPGANTYAGASLLGAATGALQPVVGGESRLANAGLGAAGGLAGQFAGNKLARVLGGAKQSPQASASAKGGNSLASANVSGSAQVKGTGGGYTFGDVGDDVSAGLNAAQKRAMAAGESLGFKMTPGQATGSRALQQLESKLESQPMTSGTFNQIKANNQTVLNRIAADAIGEKADTLDNAVLANAQERISNVYKMVANDKPRAINPDEFLNRLGAIESEFEGMVKLTDNGLVKKFLSYASNGQATGRQLQDLASKMGKMASSQMTSPSGDRAMGMALFQVKEHVDDLLESGLKGQTLKKFGEARQQYRNLMLLTQRNGVINPSSGDVAGNALAGLLQQKDRGGFLFGKNQTPLYEAARFAQAFRPIVGDSGTATRSALPSPTDFVLSLPFNIATKAYTSGPVVNASAGYGDLMREGLIDPRYLQYLPQATGLLSGATASQ
jgi:hypothetical protein